MKKESDISKARKYLTMVNRGGKHHVRHLTYRERWFKKHGLTFKPRAKRIVHAEDEAVSLKKHDDQYHDGRYEEGQKCKLREYLAKGDDPDVSLRGQGKFVRPSWITPEMDAEYVEAFDGFEDAEARNDFDAKRKYGKLLTELLRFHARHAFANSKLKDEDGDPTVLYHGTEKGGFTVFDTDGSGKTKDTGAWFTDDIHNAKSYSGSTDDVQFQRITESYLRENNYLQDGYGVIKADGTVDEDSFSSTEEEVRDWAGDLGEGERIAKIYQTEDANGYTELHQSVKDAAEHAKLRPSDFSDYDLKDQDCVYTVYVNMKDPYEIDAHGDSWDDVRVETQVFEDDELVDSFYTLEEAEEKVRQWQEENPDKNYTIESYGQSSDEIVRDARLSGDGYDGVALRNCSDGGSHGYCIEETNDFIVFDPRNIKMCDMVTFDDHGNVIPLSRRFDFTNEDVRY